ncbi:9757_t:CDS:2, partial [Scutellospora calospora]
AGSHRRASLVSQSHATTVVLRRTLAECDIIKSTVHPCLPRSEDKSVDGDPLCSLTFREDSIITT